jgi:hypothetical protein
MQPPTTTKVAWSADPIESVRRALPLQPVEPLGVGMFVMPIDPSAIVINATLPMTIAPNAPSTVPIREQSVRPIHQDFGNIAAFRTATILEGFPVLLGVGSFSHSQPLTIANTTIAAATTQRASTTLPVWTSSRADRPWPPSTFISVIDLFFTPDQIVLHRGHHIAASSFVPSNSVTWPVQPHGHITAKASRSACVHSTSGPIGSAFCGALITFILLCPHKGKCHIAPVDRRTATGLAHL